MTNHTDHRSSTPGNHWRLAGWSAAALLLLLPLVAMAFTDAVAWGPMDFLLAAALLAGLGLGCEWAVRRSGNWAYRAGAGLALATAFTLVWANAAVGIVGAEDEPLNGLFHAVVATGLAGAWLARFQAKGLACAMLLTAAAHLLAVWMAAAAGLKPEPFAFALAGSWIGAAALFWKSGKSGMAATGGP